MKENELRITELYRAFGLNPEESYVVASSILEAYRIVGWEATRRIKERNEMLGVKSDRYIPEKVSSWEAFSSNKAKADLEFEVQELYRTTRLIEEVDKAVEAVKKFPQWGECYYNVLSGTYINKEVKTGAQIQQEMHISKSYYYQLKREAVLLFAFSLWLNQKNK